MDRGDVERIVENILRELSIQAILTEKDNPHILVIVLKLGDRELSRTYVDVIS